MKAVNSLIFQKRVTNHDLVVILGNLIDNSFDALVDSTKTTKEVDVFLKGNEQGLILPVSMIMVAVSQLI